MRSRSTLHLALPLGAALTAACAAAAPDGDPEIDDDEVAQTSAAIVSDLDGFHESAPAELELRTGRATKIPVSWFAQYSLTLSNAHDVMFRAVCSAADSEVGRCDTGLLVSWGVSSSLFNDNDTSPGAHGAGPGGSFVDPPAQAATTQYTVRAFSLMRATSRTRVQYSTNGGATWASLSGTVEVGGTVVRVGALQVGDYLEVESHSNGAGHADTNLVLFSTTPAPERPVLATNDQSATDRDPRLNIAGAGWQNGYNYVLLGKAARSTGTNMGVETRVDLVHGPLSVVTSVSRTSCNGPCGAQIAAGRYLVYVFATIDLPVGAYNSAANQHLSGKMPELGGKDGCPSNERDHYGDATWYRGVPNDIAMTMQLERRDGATWKTIVNRKIPRGAFGAAPDHGWNKFALPLEVTTPGEYRVVTIEHVPGIELFGNWRYERNPEATELKVVSYNALYGGTSFNHAKYKNLANLLGTRGSIFRSELRVEERLDQAPFQWEADVLGLQEVAKENDDNDPDNKYTDVVLAELLARGSLDWTFAQGRGETFSYDGAGAGPGMSPLFVNSHFYPDATSSKVYFSSASKAAAGCQDNGGLDYFTECHLSEQGMGDGEIYNYASAAKLAAWRGDEAARPISVFNVHMESSEGPADFAPRVGELKSLMNIVDKLLIADHRAFNRAPETDGAKSSPKHYQNRFMIVGDWNVRAHECGEHYWMLRMLRERYGYAVDVSMAKVDFTGSLKQSMHVGDSGYGADEVPVGYQHMWTDDPRSPPAWTAWSTEHEHGFFSDFPWWAVDWRGKTPTANNAGERLSMIVLVGRGWAYDDPVLDYTVMSDSNDFSPMNLHGRGVEMWQPTALGFPICPDEGAVSNHPTRSYAPNHSLGCDYSASGGTNPGAPALHSDHKPMGARLRIWSR
ncbi:MAG: hypothetical protein HY698_06645 [Deltaproteobacteria bacterium]|nr:hypothetical protein [Deltaproteobacteria bacterium]